MYDFADFEACHERLHRAGWSIGEVGTSSGWLVTGTSGETVIHASVRAGDPPAGESRPQGRPVSAGAVKRGPSFTGAFQFLRPREENADQRVVGER
jgi:hypothetical protein